MISASIDELEISVFVVSLSYEGFMVLKGQYTAQHCCGPSKQLSIKQAQIQQTKPAPFAEVYLCLMVK